MNAAAKEDAEQDQIVLHGKTIHMTLSEILLACDALEPIEEVFKKFRPRNVHLNQRPQDAKPLLRGRKRRRLERDKYNYERSIKDSYMEPTRPCSFISSSSDAVFSEPCSPSVSSFD